MSPTGNYGATQGKPNAAARMIVSFSGPVASVKHCPFCKNPVEGVAKFTFRKNRGGGRGAGLGWGAGVTSKLAAHIRAEHAEDMRKYQLGFQDARAGEWQVSAGEAYKAGWIAGKKR